MEKFARLKAIAAPLLRINVDTDAIIPSREIKRVSKVGLSDGLFAGWRYTEPGGRADRRHDGLPGRNRIVRRLSNGTGKANPGRKTQYNSRFDHSHRSLPLVEIAFGNDSPVRVQPMYRSV